MNTGTETERETETEDLSEIRGAERREWIGLAVIALPCLLRLQLVLGLTPLSAGPWMLPWSGGHFYWSETRTSLLDVGTPLILLVPPRDGRAGPQTCPRR